MINTGDVVPLMLPSAYSAPLFNKKATLEFLPPALIVLMPESAVNSVGLDTGVVVPLQSSPELFVPQQYHAPDAVFANTASAPHPMTIWVTFARYVH